MFAYIISAIKNQIYRIFQLVLVFGIFLLTVYSFVDWKQNTVDLDSSYIQTNDFDLNYIQTDNLDLHTDNRDLHTNNSDLDYKYTDELGYIPFQISSQIPSGRQNIFFIESSQPDTKILHINPRQACSIESAALQNYDWNIFFYIVEANGYSFDEDPLWNVLNSISNVHVKVIDSKEFTKDTPIEHLFQKELNSPENYIKYHRSDLLRYTLLWKYAGTYLDLDVISQKPLKSLNYNYAISQERSSLNKIVAGAGIINFDSNEIGRNISNIILMDLAQNFNGNKWDDSSVRVLSRALSKICGTNVMREVNEKNCKGFKLYPYHTFYAIHYSQSKYLFEPKYYKAAMELTNKSIGIHAWSKLTGDFKLEKNTQNNIALLELAKKSCPSTFHATNKYF